jgi:flagellar assembly protein FliH
MRKPRLETLQLPARPREVRLQRVLSRQEAHALELEDCARAHYERGRIEGERALSELLVQQRQETQDLFHGVLKSLQDAAPQVIRDTEQALVGLALEIARKIVSETPITVPAVEALVRETVSQVEGNAEIHILLHPADLDMLRKLKSPLLEADSDVRQARFHASNDVTRGGCLVNTRFGTLDARRETKFDLLKRELMS